MKNLVSYFRDFFSNSPTDFSSGTSVRSSNNAEPTAVEIQRLWLDIDKMKGHNLITSIEKGTGDELRVTVSDRWQPNPYDLRLQAAQGTWRMWATIHSPEDPDRAFIKFVDEQGNWVGGSGEKASQIEVTKDG